MRTLVGYNHVAGAPGNVVVPDLATNLGTVSKDGKTYTFHLKNGIKFGPPLNREITSKDILFAFERIGTPALDRAVRVLLQRDQGHDGVRGRQGEDDLGHPRRPTRRRSSST